MQRYFDWVQDQNGTAVASVTVSVYKAGTQNLATIYSDNGTTAKDNPFTSEEDGSYEFYAANGLYDITLAKTGYTFDADDTADVRLWDCSDLFVDVAEHATDGTGTSDDPWTGWDSAITWSANTAYYFQPGYFERANVEIGLKTGMTLFGAGIASVIKSGSANQKNILGEATPSSAVTGVVIRDLQLDGNRANINFPTDDADGNGIRFNQVSHSRIVNVYLHDIIFNGVSLYNASNDNVVEQCRIEDVGKTGVAPGVASYNGIFVEFGANRNKIHHNRISATRESGIWETGHGADTYDNEYSYNFINSAELDGIKLGDETGTSSHYRWKVYGNEIDVGSLGVRVYHSGASGGHYDGSIVGNTIQSSDYGIVLFHRTNSIQIRGNHTTSNTTGGIFLSGTSVVDTIVADNVSLSNGTNYSDTGTRTTTSGNIWDQTVRIISVFDQPGATAGAKLVAAAALVPADGAILDATRITGAQTSAESAITLPAKTTLILGPVTLTMSGPFEIGGNEVTIRGLGLATTLKANANSKINLIEVDTSHSSQSVFPLRCTIRDITIDGNKSNFTAIDGDDAYWQGIWLSQCSDTLVENVVVNDCVYHGIVLTEGGSTANFRNKIRGCSVNNCGQGASPITGGTADTGIGIFLEAGPTECVVVGNDVRNCISGIVLKGASNLTRFNTVVGNVCRDNTRGFGIQLADANAQYNVVVGNVITGSTTNFQDSGTANMYQIADDLKLSNASGSMRLLWSSPYWQFTSSNTFQFAGGNKVDFSDGITIGAGPSVTKGTGSPEGVLTAPVGSLYQRTDGGASTTLYVKESGAGNTGWVAK